nr:MAG: hypothetical protein DIU67_03645 [Actinomycetota bacterium]
MEARVYEGWPKGTFLYEPKWDGFRSLSWSDPEIRLDSRNERPLLRYFPELRPALEQLPPGTVVDGEIVVVVDGATDFDALQQRIHPAQSRIERLSREFPARLVAFDLLAIDGEDLRPRPFRERRERRARPPPPPSDPGTPRPRHGAGGGGKAGSPGLGVAGGEGVNPRTLLF